MDARGNKLSSCQIPDHYLKKQKSYWTFRTLAEKKEKKKKGENKIQRSKELWEELKSYGTPFSPKLLFII